MILTNIMTTCIGILATLFSYVIAAKVPNGINNGQNNGYMSSVLQNLYHISAVRKAVLDANLIRTIPDDSSSSKISPKSYVINVFKDLQTKDSTVNVSSELYKTFEKDLTRWKNASELGGVDDDNIFCIWMLSHGLPNEAGRLFEINYSAKDSFVGIPYSRKTGKYVSVIIRPTNIFREMNLEMAVNEDIIDPLDNIVIKKSTDSTLNQDLDNKGIVRGKLRNLVSCRTIINPARSILVIHVPNPNTDRSLWYKMQMQMKHIQYRLGGMIVHSDGKFYAIVCTDPAKTWYRFDGHNVEIINKEDSVLGHRKNVVTLFYVCDGETEECKDGEESTSISSQNSGVVRRRQKVGNLGEKKLTATSSSQSGKDQPNLELNDVAQKVQDLGLDDHRQKGMTESSFSRVSVPVMLEMSKSSTQSSNHGDITPINNTCSAIPQPISGFLARYLN